MLDSLMPLSAAATVRRPRAEELGGAVVERYRDSLHVSADGDMRDVLGREFTPRETLTLRSL